MSDIDQMNRIDRLFETLAEAIDEVRGGNSDGPAHEMENQFLARLAFLALQQLNDSAQHDIIALAKKRVGYPVLQ